MEQGTGRGGHEASRPLRPEALLRPPSPSPSLPDREVPGRAVPGGMTPGPRHAAPGQPGAGAALPLLPGFREIAARRLAGSAQHLIAELTTRRQAAGLSQTQVAARMGTSQSAVARLESAAADVRVSTLERYAAAVGSQLSWQLAGQRADPGREEPR